MKIDALDVYLVKNPLINPWRTAYGEDKDIFTVLLKMTSGSDSAWSEASPLFAPTYSPEYAAGVFHVVTEFLAPLVLGRIFDSPSQIMDALSVIKGNPFAKSAVEIAWWTLESKIGGKPLHELLGGSYQEVATGADFGIQDSIDILLGLIDGAVRAGYPRVKLKAKRGWDLNMLQAVRSTFPRMTFHIDCNSGYTLEDLPLFRKIDQIGLAMIEQPLFHADIMDHAQLQKQIETPICLDESISSPRAAREAIAAGSCRYINIKPGRVGGLWNALQVNALCEQAGIGCWIGGMLESAVGAGICIELATISNMKYPSDLFPSAAYYRQELSRNEIRHSSPGAMMPSRLAGNAYVPETDRLLERTVASRHLETGA